MSRSDTAPLRLEDLRISGTGHWRHAQQRVGDVRFVAETPLQAAQRIVESAVRADRTAGEHVHLANAYTVALASTQPEVRCALTDPRARLLPDGKPLTWLSALRRDRPRLRQVRGPQLMLDVADLGREAGLRHFLLGGSEQVLAELRANLESRFPGIDIAGESSPPFRPATPDELLLRDAGIAASGAQIVWVGLGTPKQDLEAARLAVALPVVAVAVGAAFDYAAGSLRPAPHWVGAIGMEWAWRFAAEPRRLWRRYTVGNVRFLLAVVAGEVRHHRAAARRRHESAATAGLQHPAFGSPTAAARPAAQADVRGPSDAGTPTPID